MSKEEIIQFLKDNLTISISNGHCTNYISVTVNLYGEEISTSSCDLRISEADSDSKFY